MLGNISGPTLIVILFIVLLLFGAPKLPGLAKSLGQSMKILKKEVTNEEAKGEEGSEGGQPESSDPQPPKNDSAAGSSENASGNSKKE